MAKQDPRRRDAGIDAYIARAQPVFRPLLEALRDAVHRHCPDVEEALKWSAPSFLYRGKILCGMAAFKQHMSFGYWQHEAVMGGDAGRVGMGSYGKMLAPADLPKAATLKADIRKAMALIDAARASDAPAKPKAVKRAKPALPVPGDLASALAGTPKALAHFDAFSPSHRREYIEWIIEAKREDTRARRIAQAIEWLGEGRHRNWKYENC